MGGWKSRPKLCRWRRLAGDETRGTIQRKMPDTQKKEVCKKKINKKKGCCWLEEIFMTCSGHKTWVRASVNQTQTKRAGINKSIQVHSNITYADICHMHYWPVGQDRDPVWLCWHRAHLRPRQCAQPTQSAASVIESRVFHQTYYKKSLILFKGYGWCSSVPFIECQQIPWKDKSKHCATLSHSEVPERSVGRRKPIPPHWRHKSIKPSHKWPVSFFF